MKNKVQDYCNNYLRSVSSFIKHPSSIYSLTLIQYQPINYLFDIFQYILLPIYSFIRLIVSSFDVIHTIGFYSLGIKIDFKFSFINYSLYYLYLHYIMILD